MTRLPARILAPILVVLAWSAVLAQATRWYEPYQQGRRAFDRGEFEVAVTHFERAISVDDRQAANKYVEGTFRTDYFPHYYLGISYLRIGRFDRAEASLARAADALPRNLATSLEGYREQARAALAKSSRTTASPSSPPSPSPSPSPRPPAPTAAVTPPPASTTEATAAREAEAARARAADLVAQGQAALPTSLSTARARFAEADRVSPGIAGSAAGLAEVGRREAEYQRAKAAVDEALGAQNPELARRRLDAARRASPEQFVVDGLENRVNVAAARARGASPTPTAPPLGPAPRTTVERLRQGLEALLRGDVDGSIALLQPAAAEPPSADTAPLHAYLGVAYATRALSTTVESERVTLQEMAIEQFRLALRGRNDYELSPRVVSPRIIELFEGARTR